MCSIGNSDRLTFTFLLALIQRYGWGFDNSTIGGTGQPTSICWEIEPFSNQKVLSKWSRWRM